MFPAVAGVQLYGASECHIILIQLDIYESWPCTCISAIIPYFLYGFFNSLRAWRRYRFNIGKCESHVAAGAVSAAFYEKHCHGMFTSSPSGDIIVHPSFKIYVSAHRRMNTTEVNALHPFSIYEDPEIIISAEIIIHRPGIIPDVKLKIIAHSEKPVMLCCLTDNAIFIIWFKTIIVPKFRISCCSFLAIRISHSTV